MHEADKVLESDEWKILYYFLYPFDTHIEKKEEEKCINYNQLKYEIARMRKMKKEDVIVVVRALGTVASRFEKLMEKLVLC